MLVNKFYVSDIKNFEEDNNVNILDFFNSLSFYGLASLIMLGNRGISEADAYALLDDYLSVSDDNTLITAYDEIKLVLFGDKVNSDDGVKADNYKSLSDIYSDFCMSLMSTGLGYSEFWSLTTKDMYRVLNVINAKITNDMNKKLAESYHLASMIGGAVWGKLPKNIPQIKNDDTFKSSTVIKSDEFGDIDSGTLSAILALKGACASAKKERGV